MGANKICILVCTLLGSNMKLALVYNRPGQTFADQELLLIFPETRGPPHILIFCCIRENLGKIYNNNNNILILVIRTK
jgi:hypothetical protein